MKYFFKVDKNSNIISYSTSRFDIDVLEIDVSESINMDEITYYRIVNGSLIFDSELKNKDLRAIEIDKLINKLRYQLLSTDYKVIKNYELLAAGLQPEYPVAELHAQRQAWRDEINELEFELAGLQ